MLAGLCEQANENNIELAHLHSRLVEGVFPTVNRKYIEESLLKGIAHIYAGSDHSTDDGSEDKRAEYTYNA